MKKVVLLGDLEAFYEVISMFICTTNNETGENAHVLKREINSNDNNVYDKITIYKGKEHLDGLIIKCFIVKDIISGSSYQHFLRNGIYKAIELKSIHKCYINISYKDLFLKIDNILYCDKKDIYITEDDDINQAICALLSNNNMNK